jgi:CRISPR/Cas system-associated endoribonuclease Cas2
MTRETYVNNAITHYEQLSKIVRPYISDEKNKIYISNFAQIQNKNDYVKLISELEKIAKENNQKIPILNFAF